MEYKYITIGSTLFDGDNVRTSYGISVIQVCDGIAIVLQSVIDVSSDRESIDLLVDTCNKLELDPIHLNDVVDDYLANL